MDVAEIHPHPTAPRPVAVDRLLRRIPVHLLAPDIFYLPYSAAAVPPVAAGRRLPAEEPHVPPPAGADGLARLRPVDAPTLGRPGRDWPRLAAALKVG